MPNLIVYKSLPSLFQFDPVVVVTNFIRIINLLHRDKDELITWGNLRFIFHIKPDGMIPQSVKTE